MDSSSDEDIDFEKSASERTKNNMSFRDHYLKERTSVTKSNTSINDSFANYNSTEKSGMKRTLTAECDFSAGQEQPLLLSFPSEIMVKIFSYLGPKDLCRCAQVCCLWSQSARDGELWRELYPVRWIFKKDWRFGADVEDMCSCNCDSEIPVMESASLSR